MNRYNPAEIEPKWQKRWAEDGRYTVTENSNKPKYYVSGMFPYPSGAGMHVGHTFEHAVVDAVARYKRAQGYAVLNPMGWDAFGLPAENYAIKTGTPPAKSTAKNIENFTKQLKRFGASIDWSREVDTSSPEYYKWTQWIFTQLFEKGLAYQKEANQWWCPHDLTVLANEQVENGRCWRCGNEVIKKSMKQWFFKITDYADALLEEIPALDWPEKIKAAQTNWIGKSSGAEVDFIAKSSADKIMVFTTRPDTLFGATFLVLAPEHPLAKILPTEEQREHTEAYIAESLKKSEIERQSEGKEKTGVFTGSYATNPLSGEELPIWVADYVLWGYGTGAVMGVPAHDERDHEFASKFELPVVNVIKNDTSNELFSGDGELENSKQFDGVQSAEARELIVQHLERTGEGRAKTTYKMRDWLVSRQRYWGAPIPIVHCQKDGPVAVPLDQLPVVLPEVEDFVPKGASVLASVTDWVHTTCPKCGGPAERETDTMDGYACSSWYLLRYTDPHNVEQAWNPKKADYWTPLDMYVGGDHAVAHLLYVRFWNHVFYDMKLVPSKEPIKKLVYHGLIGAEDGRKMSKSLGNVVDPLEVINQGYGADALRTFELFLGPINENSNWSSRGIAGVYRFLTRAWTITQEYIEADKPEGESRDLLALRHRTIKKVTSDVQRLSFNTAIAALMEYVNELYRLKTTGFSTAWQQPIETLVQLLSIFAPHISAELWQQLGMGDSLDTVEWPEWDEALTKTETITVVAQINGKVRAEITASSGATREELEKLALENVRIQELLAGAEPKRVIVVPGRLVNIVV